MGLGFNFSEWCDQWLTTSGINILEPVVEYNADSSVKSFSIKQSCDLRGKNVLRKQKLNVAFYDNEFKPQIIKDIVISDKEAFTSVDFDFKGPVQAIVINFDEHAYTKVKFDQKTIDNLERNLYKIEDALSRSMVWHQLWYQVMDCKMSSIQYINITINQLPHEYVEQNLSYCMRNLQSLIAYYILTYIKVKWELNL